MSGPAVDEWARALRCLASAEILLQSGDPDSSVSRSYYAAFHAAVAYFLVEGREFGTHEAVESAFHRDLVRSGRVTNSVGASYTRLRELRMIGDYGVETHVDTSAASDALRRASEIVDELRRLSDGRLK